MSQIVSLEICLIDFILIFQSCKGDPCEYQKRIVTCVAPKLICNPLTKPPERRQCGNITCGRWRVGKWEKVLDAYINLMLICLSMKLKFNTFLKLFLHKE